MVSFLSASAFLVLFLSVKPRVLLVQLLHQIMVLLGKVFHDSGKSLNLSFKGSYTQFVSMNIVGGRHRASKYHATLCLRSDSIAYNSQFPRDGAS